MLRTAHWQARPSRSEEHRTTTEGGWNAANAARVVLAAAQTMCPDTLPYIQRQYEASQGQGQGHGSDQRHQMT
jgi:hypothetical protein